MFFALFTEISNSEENPPQMTPTFFIFKLLTILTKVDHLRLIRSALSEKLLAILMLTTQYQFSLSFLS